MRNQEAVERVAAQEATSDVALVKEIECGNANLTVWRSSGIKPARKIVVLECEDDRLIVPNRDFEEFALMLKEVRPSFNDADSFVKIFSEASPSRRKVLVRKDQVLPKYQDVWKPVNADGSAISFYCDDLLEGTFERITVNSDYTVDVEAVGPSRRFELR